ncbi:MAG: signal peptidase I [Acidimicrobiia bacterium]
MPARKLWWGVAVGTVAALPLGRLLFRIAEQSMAPALLPGDYVLTLPARNRLRRGDVVVFEHPLRPGFYLVKRVIGLPGDTLDGEDCGRLGPDQVFVLGDQGAWSADDGRTLGPLPSRALRWRVVLRVWPPHRVGRPRP